MEDIRNSIGVLIVGANKEGNLAFLKEKELTGELDPLEVKGSDKINWLHSANLLNCPVQTMDTSIFSISKAVFS